MEYSECNQTFMASYNTIEIQEESSIATVWLNRPEVHNAFNDEMIHELLDFFTKSQTNDQIRVIVIRGRGKSFCAGADLKWMQTASELDYKQNYLESRTLAQCLYAVYTSPKPVIALTHGSVMGGGNGLVAAADFAMAVENSQFAFSEVKLGLVPAVISPYVFRKIGEARSRELMLLAYTFDAAEAEYFGFVNRITNEPEQEYYLGQITEKLLQNNPTALASTKKLLQKLNEIQQPEEWMKYTSEVIAKARVSSEGQEGMKAFLNKKKPSWYINNEKIRHR